MRATVLAMLLVLAASAASADECKAVREKVRVKKVGDCRIETRTGVFEKKAFSVEYSVDSLHCRQFDLIPGRQEIQSAKSVCEEKNVGDGVLLPHEIQQSVKVVSRFRELMSVEISNAGFTGGAHPYAVILRATYSQKTGERVDLGDLYGAASAAELLKKAEKEFEKRGMSDYYRFEPASFSLAAAGASKVKITFSAPHADETYRGTTLEVSVTTAAPKIK